MSAESATQCSTVPVRATCDSSCDDAPGNFVAKSASSSGEKANDKAACGSSWIKACSAAARCARTVAAWPRTPTAPDAFSCNCPCNCNTLLFRERTCAARSLSCDELEFVPRPWAKAIYEVRSRQTNAMIDELAKTGRFLKPWVPVEKVLIAPPQAGSNAKGPCTGTSTGRKDKFGTGHYLIPHQDWC